ncbi:MAG: hypothetical protein U5Q44_04470 [Dehalococcoidia bacterium]|nr:hypothetical protein [Dehalococcoidia bacterium]
MAFVDGSQLLIADLDGLKAAVSMPRTLSLEWSPDSERLAVGSESALSVLDAEGLTLATSDIGGSNVRWAPGGHYLALFAVQGAPDTGMRVEGYLRVVGANTGDEVLRIRGAGSCVNDHWMQSQVAIDAGDQMVRVPSGEVVDASSSASGKRRVVSEEGTLHLQEDGRRLASVEITVSAAMQYHGEELRDITTDGRGFLLLGRGGQGVCGTYSPALVVDRPPLPPPIPTPSS